MLGGGVPTTSARLALVAVPYTLFPLPLRWDRTERASVPSVLNPLFFLHRL